MKKCSAFLTIKEMQIKIKLKFHLTPVIMAIIKVIHTDTQKQRIQTITNADKVWGKRNTHTLLVRM
jgi:hypothetical protein